ncbi:MAG TPA: hypothetical protein VGL13_07865 [Polyangiaceae bacterium]
MIPRRRVLPIGVAMALAFSMAWFPSELGRAGCAVPEPTLLLPVDGQQAPLNSRITLTLGGRQDVYRKLALRPVGGRAISVLQSEVPGGPGTKLVQLAPDAPLAPNTRYEVVAFRPEGWHPRELIFGTFETGAQSDSSAPNIVTASARAFEYREGPDAMRRWVELTVRTEDGDHAGTTSTPMRRSTAKMFAIWLPNAAGRTKTSGSPDLHLFQDGAVVRIGVPEPCGMGNASVRWPSTAAELGVAAVDESNHRSTVVRVRVDFRHAEQPGHGP